MPVFAFVVKSSKTGNFYQALPDKGIMGISSPRITLGIFLVFYLFFLNYNLVSDLGFDEARHSTQGLFFAEYVETLMSGEWQTPQTFLESSSTKNYAIAWYALYDPPVHALSQAAVFSVLGADPWTARFTTMLWAVFGSLLLFFLARSALHDEWWAVGTTLMFLFFPFTYYFSRQAKLAIPIALMTCGWLYFRFYSSHRYRQWFSALCLIAAGLMQYQTMIFFAAFALVNTIVVFVQEQRIHRRFSSSLKHALGKSSIRSMLLSLALYLIVLFPWFWMSLRSTNIAAKLFEAGVVEVKGGALGTLAHYLSFFTQLFQETWGIAVLALLGCWAILRAESLRRHWPPVLYIVTTLIVASILMSNKQLRYVSHVMGPIAILAVLGLKHRIASFSHSTRRLLTYALVLIVLSSLLVADLRESARMSTEWGERVDDAYDFIAKQPLPRIVVGMTIPFNVSSHNTSYYHSPDLFVFRSMMINDNPNPLRARQSILRIEISRDGELEKFLDFLSLTNSTHTHMVLLHKGAMGSPEGRQVGDVLTSQGFVLHEFKEHIVFVRTQTASQINSAVFPSVPQQASALLHLSKGREAFEKEDFISARDEFATAMRRDPLLFEARSNLAKVLRREAMAAQSRGDLEKARALLRDALVADPSYDLAREQLQSLSHNVSESRAH